MHFQEKPDSSESLPTYTIPHRPTRRELLKSRSNWFMFEWITYLENPLLQLRNIFNNNYCTFTPITSNFKRLLKIFHHVFYMSWSSENTEEKETIDSVQQCNWFISIDLQVAENSIETIIYHFGKNKNWLVSYP